MNLVFEFAALFCTALFAGVALYINLVEHPARMECGTLLAATVFGPSYRRATPIQASLAIIACLSALASWWMTGQTAWLAGAILIGSVVPFTLFVILPTNKKLLHPSLDRSSQTAQHLLMLWARLHSVRTACSLIALLIFLAAPFYNQPFLHVREARESILRQDLFELRSLISQYTLDKQKAPQSLDDLVQAGYIKMIPKDPMTNEANWEVVREEDTCVGVVCQQDRGIIDVRSASCAIGTDGRAYSKWLAVPSPSRSHVERSTPSK